MTGRSTKLARLNDGVAVLQPLFWATHREMCRFSNILRKNAGLRCRERAAGAAVCPPTKKLLPLQSSFDIWLKRDA